MKVEVERRVSLTHPQHRTGSCKWDPTLGIGSPLVHVLSRWSCCSVVLTFRASANAVAPAARTSLSAHHIHARTQHIGERGAGGWVGGWPRRSALDAQSEDLRVWMRASGSGGGRGSGVRVGTGVSPRLGISIGATAKRLECEDPGKVELI